MGFPLKCAIIATMLQLKKVTLRRDSKVLLENADLIITPGEKIGFIGSNGAGKSSLFSLVLNRLECDAGDVDLIKNIRIAEIRQDIPAGPEPIIEYVLNGDSALADLRKEIQHAEITQNGGALVNLYQRFADLDGYTAESRAAKLLIGLGFSHADLKRAIDEFSGGWRMRLNLARVLMAPADLLLLDEPTNHLDLEAIVWLEDWLCHLTSTIFIISHDREFLDHVVKRIVHLANSTLKSYSGNYSAFEEQYAQALLQQSAAYQSQQRQLQHLQSFVDRFRYKASKARQAQGRLKMIERMEKVAPVHAQNPFQFEFYTAPPAGDPLINFSHLNIGYGADIILHDVSFSIYQGDRIALIGPNGAGKSTLVKAIAGKLSLTDKIDHNSKLQIGYFTQHQIEDLQLQESSYWHIQQAAPKMLEKEIRQFLGGFNFQGDRVFEPLTHFSGGEKARLALALLVLKRPNLLLLDEPTNHLDLEMREALTHALQHFAGALLLITHDRYLLKSLADDLYLVANSKVQKFTDDISAYETWLLTENKRAEVALPKSTPLPKNPVKNLVRIQQQIEKLEQKITVQQQALIDIEKKLLLHYSDSTSQADANQLLAQQKKIQQDIEQLESDLLALL